ncbi:hypothetical protein ACFVTM_18070 [Arthrobacter sp. NPDC058130]|uniref:hypothetical protein n=1 Tax=Arthrobacter sp. NPDC058130 TaxID=3346353 RepID=UPI0036E84990
MVSQKKQTPGVLAEVSEDRPAEWNLTPEPREPRLPACIDDLAASPWVGLHFRHEFLLQHSHELLELFLPASP